MINKPRVSPIISKLKMDAASSFISPFDLENRLKDLAVELGVAELGFQVAVEEAVHEWGRCEGKPILKDRLDAANLALFVSEQSDAADLSIQQQLHHLIGALAEVWGKNYRKHGALNIQASGAEEMLNSALMPMTNLHNVTKFSVIYVDLDNFRQINNKGSHGEGDKALRFVCAEMHKLCREYGGLAFIAGGDEFLLVLPCEQTMEVSYRLWTLKNQIGSIGFGQEGEFYVGLTAGVVRKTVEEISAGIQVVKEQCEALTKEPDEAKNKRRGTINFESVETSDEAERVTNPSEFLKLGVCLSKSRQFCEHSFEDERLNLIVQEVASLGGGELNAELIKLAVDKVLQWFGAKMITLWDERSLLARSGTPSEISDGAVAVAIVHAIAKVAVSQHAPYLGAADLAIIWSEDTQQSGVFQGDKLIWGYSGNNQSGRIEFGDYVVRGEVGQAEGVAIGVQIGFEENPKTPGGRRLPNDFLVDHVRVDVRPRTGGGLPDFWQAALAQIVAALNTSNKHTKVIVWGEKVESTELYTRLIDENIWAKDEIASLTGLPTTRVASLVKNLHKSVIKVASEEELLETLFSLYNSYTGPSVELADVQRGEEPSLQRPMVQANPLTQEEGIVCTTARVAYPLVIDTLRKTHQVRLAVDDSGQEQRELIAFKLKLTNPGLDPIPDYLMAQKDNLSAYAEKVLLSDDGVIRAELERDKQVEAYCSHLARYINRVQDPRSTRRACLVVRHLPDEQGSPKPLGLISVWSTPRFEAGIIYLDYVFVWRTVEAFIGLPYSLYGSLRLAEQLVERVALVSSVESGNIRLGELNYIALSLHIGSDQFHTRVAKQIVDKASD
ncbi:hypothetical protein AO391_11590 [Pseudomonas marginalis ICMP 9505]|nr:hypothetical protein AO391_11590 [Pseudomonas marginalis ICMP 9505]